MDQELPLQLQSLALQVFENKQTYSDNDFIVIMNILMESYNKSKGFYNDLNSYNEKPTKEEDTEGAEQDTITRYTTYDSDADSDDETYTGSYLSPY
tara:strand:- start:566 stop:853 length:288 start_codon:yes stop_codon:yes gene_type:complete